MRAIIRRSRSPAPRGQSADELIKDIKRKEIEYLKQQEAGVAAARVGIIECITGNYEVETAGSFPKDSGVKGVRRSRSKGRRDTLDQNDQGRVLSRGRSLTRRIFRSSSRLGRTKSLTKKEDQEISAPVVTTRTRSRPTSNLKEESKSTEEAEIQLDAADIMDVQSALKEMEKQLILAKRQGKTVSRAKVMDVLLSVVDSLEQENANAAATDPSNVECSQPCSTRIVYEPSYLDENATDAHSSYTGKSYTTGEYTGTTGDYRSGDDDSGSDSNSFDDDDTYGTSTIGTGFSRDRSKEKKPENSFGNLMRTWSIKSQSSAVTIHEEKAMTMWSILGSASEKEEKPSSMWSTFGKASKADKPQDSVTSLQDHTKATAREVSQSDGNEKTSQPFRFPIHTFLARSRETETSDRPTAGCNAEFPRPGCNAVDIDWSWLKMAEEDFSKVLDDLLWRKPPPTQQDKPPSRPSTPRLTSDHSTDPIDELVNSRPRTNVWGSEEQTHAWTPPPDPSPTRVTPPRRKPKKRSRSWFRRRNKDKDPFPAKIIFCDRSDSSARVESPFPLEEDEILPPAYNFEDVRKASYPRASYFDVDVHKIRTFEDNYPSMTRVEDDEYAVIGWS